MLLEYERHELSKDRVGNKKERGRKQPGDTLSNGLRRLDHGKAHVLLCQAHKLIECCICVHRGHVFIIVKQREDVKKISSSLGGTLQLCLIKIRNDRFAFGIG